MTAALWFLNNWRTALTLLGALSAFGFVTYFFLDYRATKASNETLSSNVSLLEQSLEDQKLATQAALAAAESFDAKLEELTSELESLAQQNIRIARRVNQVRQDLIDANLDNLVRVNPEQAGAVASNAINSLGRLSECATLGNTNCTNSSPDAARENTVATAGANDLE